MARMEDVDLPGQVLAQERIRLEQALRNCIDTRDFPTLGEAIDRFVSAKIAYVTDRKLGG